MEGGMMGRGSFLRCVCWRMDEVGWGEGRG